MTAPRTHDLTLPLDPDAVRALRVGDFVYLTGEIHATAGLPTHERLLRAMDGAEALPFDMQGGALFHLGSLNTENPDGTLTIAYMNPTTSTRFNALMPRLIAGLGLRATGGKGGLDAACAAAMAQSGCIYLSFPGGGAPIITDAIRRVTGIGWPEMISHYRIVRLQVERLGPLTVGIDALGNSVYDQGVANASSRRDAILAQMRAERDGPTKG
jgi:fumarate hydratase subunit beta